MNKNMKKVMRLMEGNGLLQAFVINAIINEADKVISFYDEDPERLNAPQIISPRAWLECAQEAQKILTEV